MRMNENPKKDQNSLRAALPLSLKEIAFLKFEKEKLIYIVSVFITHRSVRFNQRYNKQRLRVRM